tara:strand:- start:393 stop:644 length:252 start_codon:yes stop_codon:yes gene_type:complete
MSYDLTFEIVVRDQLADSNIILSVKTTDTIMSIKNQCEVKNLTKNFTAKEYILCYYGKRLEDEKNLSFYNITSYCKLLTTKIL